ncbi:hypothetical protein PSYPI_38292, partial [Pseudomonas syringae pv. pisi str. 1704B]
FICNDDGRNDEAYQLISQGRLDGACRDAWEASAPGLTRLIFSGSGAGFIHGC